MLGIAIIAVGFCMILVALVLIKEKNIAKWLEKKNKVSINNRDLANWFRLNMLSMGGLICFVGIASLFFAHKNPGIFAGVAGFIIIIFTGLLRMGYQLLLKKEKDDRQ